MNKDRILQVYKNNVNTLDNYSNATYHLRLYAIKEEHTFNLQKTLKNPETSGSYTDLFPHQPVEGTDYITICETGTNSRFSIDNLVFETVPAYSQTSGTANFGSMTFTLKEVSGAVLFDYINDASDRLGIQNFLKSPFYFEISFKAGITGNPKDHMQSERIKEAKKAFDEGSISILQYVAESEVAPEGNQIGYWTIPIYITKMDFNLTEGGSIYEVTAVPAMFYHAVNHNNSRLKSTYTTPFQTSLKTTIMNLQEDLNKREVEKTEGSKKIHCIPDKWTFILDEEFGDFNVSKKSVDPTRSNYLETTFKKATKEQEKEQKEYERGKGGAGMAFKNTRSGKVITSVDRTGRTYRGGSGGRDRRADSFNVAVDQGVHIVQLLNDIMKSTKEIQDAAIKEKDNDFNEKELWKIYTDVIVLGYDPLREDYAVERQYIIKKYTTTSVYKTKEHTNLKPPTVESSFIHLTHILNNGSLRKFYDYYYTGHNTQIIDFNTSFDFSWYSLIARNNEGTSSSAQNDVGRSSSPNNADVNVEEICRVANKTTNPDIPYKISTLPMKSDDETWTQQTDESIFIQLLLTEAYSKPSADLLTIEMTIKGDPFWMDPPSSFYPFQIRSTLQVQNQVKENKSDPFNTSEGNHFGRYHPDRDIYIYVTFRAPLPESIYRSGNSSGDGSLGHSSILGGVYHVTGIKHIFSEGVFKQELKAVRFKKIVTHLPIEDVLARVWETIEFDEYGRGFSLTLNHHLREDLDSLKARIEKEVPGYKR